MTMADPKAVKEFAVALAADCAGRQKQVAAEAFGEMRVEVAEAEATNIFHLRRRPTFGLLLEAMGDGDRTAALAYLAERAGYRLERVVRDPAATREAVRVELAGLAERIGGALERLDAADADERRLREEHARRGPHRAAPPDHKGRRAG